MPIKDEIAAKIHDEMLQLIVDLVFHLEYVNWGNSWERECSETLRARVNDFKAQHPEEFKEI